MKVSLEEILHTTLEVLDIQEDMFYKALHSRIAFAVKVKQIVSYVAKKYGYSYLEIGLFLELDHSTIVHNKKKAEDYASCEKEYRQQLEDIFKRLKEIENSRQEHKVNGLITRDKNGFIFLHVGGKPIRYDEGWEAAEDGESFNLPEETFPQLTWGNEPVECEMTLRLK